MSIQPHTVISSPEVLGLLGINVKSIVNSVLSVISSWVGSAAKSLLGSFGQALNATTSVHFGSGFMAEFNVLRMFGAELLAGSLCIVTIQAVLQRDLSLLLRSIFLRLPAALLFSGVALEVITLLLQATDGLSSALLAGAGSSIGTFVAGLGAILVGSALTSPAISGFEGLMLAAIFAVVVFICWLELAVRAAAIAIAALFIPLALAGVVWPMTQQWMRRLGETLLALIMSKVVIAAIYALAISSMGAANGGNMVLEGIAMFVLCAWSPFTLFHLIPLMEGAATGHFESLSHRGGQALRHLSSAAGPIVGDVISPGAAAGVDQSDGIGWAPTDPTERLEIDPEDAESFRFLGSSVVLRDNATRERNEDGSFRPRPPSYVHIDPSAQGGEHGDR